MLLTKSSFVTAFKFCNVYLPVDVRSFWTLVLVQASCLSLPFKPVLLEYTLSKHLA